MFREDVFDDIILVLFVMFWFPLGVGRWSICCIGGGWEYSFRGSYLLSVSFKKVFGRNGNFFLSVDMSIGFGVWWMKSYISLWMVLVGFTFLFVIKSELGIRVWNVNMSFKWVS